METQKQKSYAASSTPISPANQMGQTAAAQKHLDQSVFENSPVLLPTLLPTLVRSLLPRRIKHDGWWLED